MTTFTAQIKRFETKSLAKIEAVVKQSAQDIFEIAQTPVAQGGNMPVDTGFLRNSATAVLFGSTALQGDGVSNGAAGGGIYVLAIAGMSLGDVVTLAWTANYAVHQEYGSQGRAGRFFMRGAAQQWQSVVTANAARIRNG